MTNLSRYGAGLLGDLTDLALPDLGRFAENDWHARVTINVRNGVDAYHAPLTALAQRGVSCLPILFWTGSDNKACAPGHPEWNQARWEDFAHRFAQLLDEVGAGAPEQVEVWNEENSMAFWPRSARSASAYVNQMLGPIHGSFPPEVALVCGGLTFREHVVDGDYRSRRAESWLADFCRQDGHRLVKRWSIHPYGRTNDDGSRCADQNISAGRAVNEIRRFKRKLNEIAERHPSARMAVWVTETGLSLRHANFDEEDQRHFLKALVEDVAKAGGYGVRAWSNWPLRDPFPPAPTVYYSGLYEAGEDFTGTNAPLKLGGDYWRDLST